MLDTILGLPLHPLIVHATVVVVPAAALAVLLAGVVPRFRRWAGFLPLALSVLGLVLVPLSTQSGEALQHRVADSALVDRHAHLADLLLPWMLALTVAAAALSWWSRREKRAEATEEDARGGSARWVLVAGAVLGVVAALGTTVQVVLIGHSGAKAAWAKLPPPGTGGGGADGQ